MSIQIPTLIHPNATIVKDNQEGIIFVSDNPQLMYIDPEWSWNDLGINIHGRLGLTNNERIYKIQYRMSVLVTNSIVRYASYPIQNDDDVQGMVRCHSRSNELGVIELCVDIIKVHIGGEGRGGGSGSEGYAVMHQVGEGTSTQMGAGEGTSTQIGATYSRLDLNIEPNYTSWYEEQDATNRVDDFASPLLDANPTEHNEGGHMDGADIRTGEDNDNADTSSEDSDENNMDTQRVSFAENPQVNVNMVVPPIDVNVMFPQHYVPLVFMHQIDLNAMANTEHDINTGSTFTDVNGNAELAVGMKFPTKEALLLAIKHYCLLNNVDHHVIESSSSKFHGKCKFYGNGCKWRLRATLRKKSQI